jgi:hypothetical protein
MHEWGEYSDAVARFGVERRDVVVFAPALPAAERRLLRLWRAWPVVAALAVVVLSALLATMIAPGWALVAAIGLVMTVTLMLRRRVHRRSRAMCAVGGVRVPGLVGTRGDGYTAAFEVASDLCLAEDGFRRGEISRPEYERRWQDGYVRAGVLAARTARPNM